MKDLHNKIEVVSLLDPIAVTTTQTITDVDLAGYNSAELIISVGLNSGTTLGASHKIVFTLQDSDATSGYADVEDADMLGVSSISSGTILTVDAESEDNTVYHFGYVGPQRYLKLVGTITGTPNLPIAITLVKSHMLDAPVIS